MILPHEYPKMDSELSEACGQTDQKATTIHADLTSNTQMTSQTESNGS